MTTFVAIDDYIGPFPVTRTGPHWNGWEAPYFSRDVAFDVACAIIEHHIPGPAGYDEERDAFWTVDTAYGEAGEARSLADVPLYDGELCIDWWDRQSDGTYGIGAVAWTWDEVEIDVLATMLADDIRDNVSREDWANMQVDIERDPHDIRFPIDTNECMVAVWQRVFGREPHGSNDHDSALWNAVWTSAVAGALRSEY
jgi:hypothetical protein